MSEYFKKARELGELILKSEESIALADARAEYEKHPEIVKQMDEYKAFHENVQESINKQLLAQEAYDIAIARLNEMAVELKKNPCVQTLIDAENTFNELFNQILGVLQHTVTGMPDKPDHECGGCGGCGKKQ
jgi:cell fate (sporulation/competence/biofilm development) regulator YlbF (YheA/YmcA/DUF963 family)